MAEKGCLENYEFKDLEEIVGDYKDTNKMRNSFTIPKEEFQAVNKFVQNKRFQLINREGTMNLFFGIHNNVDLYVSKNQNYSLPRKLIDDCIEFINDLDEKRANAYVLEGKSGGGKSQFLIYLMKNLNSLYK